MTEFNITVAGIDQAFAGLDKRTIAKGLSRGLNKMAAQVRTHISTWTRARYDVTAARIKKAMYLYKANIKNLTSILHVRGSDIPLIAFRASQTKRGVTVKISKQKPRKLLPGRFIATAPRLARQAVFERKAGVVVRRGPKGQALPIREVRGPSLPQLMGSKEALRNVSTFVQEKLESIITHEIMYEVERKTR